MSGKKRAEKPAAKPARPPKGKPFAKGHDPRRNLLTPGPGRPSDAFKAEMRELASSPAAMARLRGILEMGADDLFLKAHAHVADRGYGKAQQHVDVTTSGQSIAEILRKGRDRVARMKAEAEARG